MQSIDFEGELNRIVEADSRYDREAYVFLRQALDFCHKSEIKAGKKTRVVEKSGENHISVAQLLDGIRQYALQEYGPMAMMVLNSWGVKSCEDFGEIVFKMVEHRLLSVTEQDARDLIFLRRSARRLNLPKAKLRISRPLSRVLHDQGKQGTRSQFNFGSVAAFNRVSGYSSASARDAPHHAR